jgi:hypothetical protein
MTNSLVGELKQRMRQMLTDRGATAFKDWKLAPGLASHFIDVRDALTLVPSWADTMVPLTKKCQLAIGEDRVAALLPATNTTSSSALRWCPNSDSVGIAALESRWWVDSSDEDD